MDKRKKVQAGIYILAVICVLVVAYAVYLQKKEPPQAPVTERKFELSTGEIYLYEAGKDYIVYSDEKAYSVFKKAILDAILSINGVAYEGRVFSENVPAGKDPGGLPGINQLKDTSIGLGFFLGTQQNLLTSIKTENPVAFGKIGDDGFMYIPADQVVIILNGENKGLIFTRNSFQKQDWVAWKTDRDKIMKLVDLIRVGTQNYEKKK